MNREPFPGATRVPLWVPWGGNGPMAPFWGCRTEPCATSCMPLSLLPSSGTMGRHCAAASHHCPVHHPLQRCSMSLTATDNPEVLVKAPEEITTSPDFHPSIVKNPNLNTLIQRAAELEHWYLNRALPCPKGAPFSSCSPKPWHHPGVGRGQFWHGGLAGRCTPTHSPLCQHCWLAR